MKQYKYIGNITREEFINNTVIVCINEEGRPCILVKNAISKTITRSFDTDNLGIKLNSVLIWENSEFYYHIIVLKDNNNETIKNFELIYDYIFKKFDDPVEDYELIYLINSIDELFRITPEQQNKERQIGLIGELLVVKDLFCKGVEKVFKKYHKNFNSKHDIEFSDKLRMEVKTTSSDQRLHQFRHDQLSRNDITVLVASVLVEEAQEGTTLFDLFQLVIEMCPEPDTRFGLNKLMKQFAVTEEKPGISFSLSKAEESIQYYRAVDLPMIREEIPDGISKISYTVDCAFARPMQIDELMNELG